MTDILKAGISFFILELSEMGNHSPVNLYVDGGSRGNLGPGSIAVLVCGSNDNQLLREYAEHIGQCSNNEAECKALLKGLDLCAHYTIGNVSCFSDSNLVVQQMNKQWRVKADNLRPLLIEARSKEQVFAKVTYSHVPRTNQRIEQADQLVKRAHQGRRTDNVHVDPTAY